MNFDAIKDDVNRFVNIKIAAEYLWYELFSKWYWERGIKDWWEETRGWSLNENKGVITDFANKWRLCWSTYNFILQHFDDWKEAIQRIEEKFSLVLLDNKKSYGSKKKRFLCEV